MTPFKVLESSLDESSDQKQAEVFCVGAFLASPNVSKGIESKWLSRLAKDEIEYFRATDCKSVNGPFKKLINRHGSISAAKIAAAKIRSDLEDILLGSRWIGFGLGVLISDYRKVLREVPEAKMFYADDPTVAGYQHMFYEVARATSEKAPNHLIAYLADGSSQYPKLLDAFMAVKAMYPHLGRQMASVAPLDDKITPSLQIADLIASVTRQVFTLWLKTGVEVAEALAERWGRHISSFGTWDEAHMIETIRSTVEGNIGPIEQSHPRLSLNQRRRQKRAAQRRQSRPGSTRGPVLPIN